MNRKPSRRDFIKGAGGVLGGAIVVGAGGVEAQAAPAVSPGARFRQLVSGPEPVVTPGAYDVMTARMIQDEGFQALVVGGSACSAVMHGVPDVGLVSITELIEYSGNIARSVDIPTMADADDGGGTPINVYRSVQRFGKAGLAAVMIEDTHQAKHLGAGEEVLPVDAFVDKIVAAVEAAEDSEVVIIARSDALSLGHSMEAALERCTAYAEAGADMIFLSGARLEDCPRVADAVQRPLMQTVSNVSLDDIRANRVSLAVYAGQLLSVAMGASYRALQEIRSTGIIPDYGEKTLPRGVQARLNGQADVVERARRYNVTG